MTFSLIICTRNRKEKLCKCLFSVVKNSLHPDELVVVDSSKDWQEIKRLVYSFKNKLSKTKIIYQKVPHKNPAFSRNQAIKMASGNILAFVDDDVILARDWLENLLLAFEDNPKIPVIGGKTLNFYPDNYWASISSKISDSFLKNPDKPHFPLTLPTLNLGIKRSFFKRYHLSFNENLCSLEDVDLNRKVRKLGFKILYQPKIKLSHCYRTSFFSFFRQQFWYGRGYQKLKPLKNRWFFCLILPKIVFGNSWHFCQKNQLSFKYFTGVLVKELAFSLGFIYQSLVNSH